MDGDCDGLTVGIFVGDVEGELDIEEEIEGENVGCVDHWGSVRTRRRLLLLSAT